MIKIEDILAGKHPTFQTGKVKAKLLAAGIKSNKCEECHVDGFYNGKPLVMHLDHINGNSTDHRLENLRMLCPNCHSQTDTYSGRNTANVNRTSLADKASAKLEKKRLADAKYDAFILPRLADFQAITKDHGYIQRLAEKWGVSHTQVIRFTQKFENGYVPRTKSK